MSKLTEKKLSREEIFKGHVVHLVVDRVELENGHETSREVVEHPGGVCVAALTEKNELLFVRQFRYPYGEVVLELPAGTLEKGSTPLENGKRELKEETGLVAQRWEKLGELVTTPGFSDETLHIYLATGLAQQETERDEDEFIELFTLPLEEAYQQAMRGALPDAKTIAGLAMAHARWTAAPTKGE